MIDDSNSLATSKALWEANLQALALIYPGLAQWAMNQPLPETRHHPQITMTPEDQDLDENWREDADLHVAYRFSEGDYARKLFDRINFAELREPRIRRLLLIEDRPDAFLDALFRQDWTALIQSEYCMWLVDLRDGQDVRSFLSRYPQTAEGNLALYCGDNNLPGERVAELRDLFSSVHSDVQARQRIFMERLPQQKLPPYPRKIRFFIPGHNALQDACVEAFRRLGHNAQRLQWKSPLFRFVRGSAWMSAIEQEEVDAALFLNATPWTFCRNPAILQIPMRRLVWFVDNPRRYAWTSQDYEGCDAIGVFDRTYLPFLRERTKAPIVEMRTGYGVDVRLACRHEEFTEVDIAFVGELGTRGFIAYEEGFRRIQPELLDAVNRWLGEVNLTQLVDIAAGIEPLFQKAGVPYCGAWVEYVENKAAALRRRYYLEAIRDLGLKIYGDAEWGEKNYAGPLIDCYAGRRIDYVNDLPRLYASAKIHINIFHPQCVRALNPRVYDVLVCGGFLLTMDNPGLYDEFEPGRDFIVFRSKTELRERVRHYLARPQEREAISRNGRERALAKCGYDDRIQTLLRSLKSLPGDRYVDLCG